MKYEIYHDESKEDGFWHVFLFVSVDFKAEVLGKLQKARKDFNGNDLSFKSLRSNASFEVAKHFLSIKNATLQQKVKGTIESFSCGKTEYCKIQKRRTLITSQFSSSPQWRIAVFRQENNHSDMGLHSDDLSKIETTFRMGVQGACHFLFEENSPLEIERIVLDKEDHYQIEHNRNFDSQKILNKLNRNFRTYCSLTEQTQISGNNLDSDDHLLLELADIFLGAFRFGFLHENGQLGTRDQKRLLLAQQIKPLIDRSNQGFARMQNSRFRNFGTFSSSKIGTNGDWNFSDISKEFLKENNIHNPTLF